MKRILYWIKGRYYHNWFNFNTMVVQKPLSRAEQSSRRVLLKVDVHVQKVKLIQRKEMKAVITFGKLLHSVAVDHSLSNL